MLFESDYEQGFTIMRGEKAFDSYVWVGLTDIESEVADGFR